MRHRVTLITLVHCFALLAPFASAAAQQTPKRTPSDTVGWVPDSVLQGPLGSEGLSPSDRIRFKNGRVVDTGLWEVEILRVFLTAHGVPYLVLLGRECTECDAAGRYIWIQTPFELPIPHSGRVRGLFLSASVFRGVWGKTEDWVDSVATESRGFLGACLSSQGQDYVVFGRYRSNDGWTIATHIGSIVGDTLHETTLEGTWALLDSVLARTRRGSCKELPRIEEVTPR